jgi:hypothetical protein
MFTPGIGSLFSESRTVPVMLCPIAWPVNTQNRAKSNEIFFVIIIVELTDLKINELFLFVYSWDV